jgi:hypothetical protein
MTDRAGLPLDMAVHLNLWHELRIRVSRGSGG